MSTTVVLLFLAAVIMVAIVFAFRYFKKPKTDIEQAQENLKKAEKIIKKKKDASDKSRQEFEAHNKEILRKNDEKIKEMRKNLGL